MVKIKTKKTMTLPQLVAWSMENGITNKWYRAVDDTEYISEVFFNESGLPQFSSTVDKSDTFTIEINEELTEDTVLPELVELYEDTLHSSDGSKVMLVNKNTSIRRAKDVDECPTLAFYIPNDDLTLDLVWTREKGLVE